MNTTKVTCTNTGKTLYADVLSKSSKFLKIAIEGKNLTVSLSKKHPNEKNYIGNASGLEFVSTGYNSNGSDNLKQWHNAP